MREYGGSMVRTAWTVLGRYGAHEADDVVQEAFIAALTTPALPASDVGAWLRAITVRKALDAARRSRRRGESPLVESLGGAQAGDPETLTDVLAVREALARLLATDRAVLVLVELEGHSMAEAAAALGITNVATRLRVVRARRKLAALLDESRR